MKTDDYSKAQGHWILAKMGKKVLRPGGRELTMKLVDALSITPEDEVVEFAPGMGYTASLVLANNPHSYVGIDKDANAVKNLEQAIKGNNISFIQANAAVTDLPSNSKDKVFGEAMLTMHAYHRKVEIIKEAHRILKKGGLYAIHELGLFPSDLKEDFKAAIQKELAQAIKVNARPLTEHEWKLLLEQEGFRIIKSTTNTMRLLESMRIINDEGFFRFLKISYNIITHAKARQRILEMRKTFKKHRHHMNAVVIIAEKI